MSHPPDPSPTAHSRDLDIKMAPEQPASQRGVSLLSLDGGGIASLWSLYVLSNVMGLVNRERYWQDLLPAKPCEVFDMIGGTNTSGLIAIMLGRLEMDVEECISAYHELAESGFQPQKAPRSLTKMFSRTQTQFDSTAVEKAILKMISRKGISPDEPFNHNREGSCKVFACAASGNSSNTKRLRSYTSMSEPGIPATIYEAILATLATHPFFAPATISGTQFTHGELSANNPAGEVEKEAKTVWLPTTGDPNDPKPLISCFVSISAGHPHLDRNDSKSESAMLVTIANESKLADDEFANTWGQHYEKNTFFRFSNYRRRIQTAGLAKLQTQGDAESAARLYFWPSREPQLKRLAQLIKDKKPASQLRESIQGHANQTTGTNIRRRRQQIPCHSLPFPKNENFVGRKAALDGLMHIFFANSNIQRASLIGLTKVGKTEVALQFAYQVQETMPHFSIFWVSGSSASRFEESYTEIAKDLDILTEFRDQDVKASVQEFLGSKKAGPWIMIVDDANNTDVLFGPSDEPGGIEKYLPDNSDGRILFTTRSRKVAELLSQSSVIDLKMDHEEATSFFKECLYSFRENLLRDTVNVIELLDELLCLPPTIAQAAAYLNRNDVSIKEYLDLLRQQNSKSKIHDTIASPWLVSIDRLCEYDSSIFDLLCLISHINPNAIPPSILPHSKSESRLAHSVDSLCEYNFLTRRHDQDVFYMSQSVQFAMRLWVDRHWSVTESTTKAIKQLLLVMPSEPRKNKLLWQECLPHAQKLLVEPDLDDSTAKLDLFYRVGTGLLKSHQTGEAVDCLTRYISMLYDRYGVSSRNVMAGEVILAKAYRKNRQTQQAVELIEQTMIKYEKNMPETDKDRVLFQYQFGRCYQENGQYKKAIETLQKVMELESRTQPADSLARMETQLELAKSLRYDGQIEEAIKLLEGIVARDENILAKDEWVRVFSQYYLARSYASQGRIEEAAKLVKEIVAVEEWLVANGRDPYLMDQGRIILEREVGSVSSQVANKV